MIEIPEAHNLAVQINKTLKGKIISSVVAAEHPHKFAWFFEDPEGYEKILKGKKITNAVARNHFLEIQIEDAKLLFQEGINLRYITDLKDMPKKHQLLVQFSDDTILSASVQMYGGLICFEGNAYENEYYTSAKVKPSPLTDAFNKAYFNDLAKIVESKQNISLKALLATEQRIPGLGNGVLQDILYNAMLHPKQKYKDLNEQQKESLFLSIKKTLQDMTDKGGRDTEKDLFGNPGAYISKLSKNTVNKPCTICGTDIKKAAYMGGSIYFCPECQKF